MKKSTIRTFVVALLVSGVLLATPAMVQAQEADDDDEQQSVLAEIRSLLDRLSQLLASIDAAVAKLDDDTLPPTTIEVPGVVGSVSHVGSYSRTGTEQYDELSLDHFGRFSGTRDTYSFSGWGVWAIEDGATLFRATISGINIQNGLSTALLDPYYTSVTGLRSFDNPVGRDTAVWTGDVRAYETHPDTFGTPVEGNARLEMDLDSFLDTIDVRFTNFDRGHFNMSWHGVFVSLGGFRSFLHGDLEGNFYGDDQEGVAGTFERDSLKGIFGAVRE